MQPLPGLFFLRDAIRFLNRLPEAPSTGRGAVDANPRLNREHVRANAATFREFLNRSNSTRIMALDHFMLRLRETYQRPFFETAAIKLGTADEFLSNLRTIDEMGRYNESSIGHRIDLTHALSELKESPTDATKIKLLGHKIKKALKDHPENDLVLIFTKDQALPEKTSDIIAHALSIASEDFPDINRKIYIDGIKDSELGRFVQHYVIRKRLRCRILASVKRPLNDDIKQVGTFMREEKGQFGKIVESLEDLETAQLLLSNPQYKKYFYDKDIGRYLSQTYGVKNLTELKHKRQTIENLFEELASHLRITNINEIPLSTQKKAAIKKAIHQLKQIPAFKDFNTPAFAAIVTHTRDLARISFRTEPRVRSGPNVLHRKFPENNGSLNDTDYLLADADRFIQSWERYTVPRQPRRLYINFYDYPGNEVPPLQRSFFGASEMGRLITRGRYSEQHTPFLEHINITGVPERDHLDILMIMKLQLDTQPEVMASNPATMRLAENFGIPPRQI